MSKPLDQGPSLFDWADALKIEAGAKRRLADEYDAAQERGEVAKLGSNQTQVGVPEGNTFATAVDIGLSRKDIHEARQIRDAEVAACVVDFRDRRESLPRFILNPGRDLDCIDRYLLREAGKLPPAPILAFGRLRASVSASPSSDPRACRARS